MMGGRKRATRIAFTLFEVLLTMAVLVVVMAIVVPSVTTRLRAASIDTAKREVYRHLMQTRTRAMDEGRAWTFTALPGGRKYQAFPTGRPHDTIAWQLADSVRFVQVGNATATNSAAADLIHFFSDGTSSEARLILQDNSGVEATITVSRLTGVAVQ